MIRFLSLATIVVALAASGCSSSEPTNVVNNADQAAVDAYNAQAAEDEKALSGYNGVE